MGSVPFPRIPLNRLVIGHYGELDNSMFTALWVKMSDVEDALLESGAEPRKDYTYMDLMRCAVELQKASIIAGTV